MSLATGDPSRDRWYRQHRVHVPVRFADRVLNDYRQVADNGQAVFRSVDSQGSTAIYEWNPLYLAHGFGDYDGTEGDTRVMGSVAGLGNYEIDEARKNNDEEWTRKLMDDCISYWGMPTGSFPLEKLQGEQQFTSHIYGTRGFFWVHEYPAPVFAHLYVRNMTASEAEEHAGNWPKGQNENHRPLIFDLYDPRDVGTLVSEQNRHHLRSDEAIDYILDDQMPSYKRKCKEQDMLRCLHNMSLNSGVLFLAHLVQTGVIELHIPVNARFNPTELGAGPLNKQQANNWLLALASKLGLLHTDYRSIPDNNMNADVRKQGGRLRLDLLRSIFPEAAAYHNLFGTDYDTGVNPGLDHFRRVLKTSPTGDMIQQSLEHTQCFFAAVGDWVYDHARNITGRVLVPAEQYSFGQFM